jgi:hypothetical protein
VRRPLEADTLSVGLLPPGVPTLFLNCFRSLAFVHTNLDIIYIPRMCVLINARCFLAISGVEVAHSPEADSEQAWGAGGAATTCAYALRHCLLGAAVPELCFDYTVYTHARTAGDM